MSSPLAQVWLPLASALHVLRAACPPPREDLFSFTHTAGVPKVGQCLKAYLMLGMPTILTGF